MAKSNSTSYLQLSNVQVFYILLILIGINDTDGNQLEYTIRRLAQEKPYIQPKDLDLLFNVSRNQDIYT